MTANNITIQLNINSRPVNTEIYFGPTIELLANLLNQKKVGAILITDQIIAQHHSSLIEKLGIKTLFLPSGEIHKTRATKQFIEDRLLQQQCGRDAILIALGGGVVLDLVGFVAATFCRGIPFISIPTTLLGMVDACLGGKTAVNTEHGKNLIGSFYFPEAIIIDPRFLDTLPQKQRLNGIAEIIKYGLTCSRALFEKLASRTAAEELIQECLEIKKEVIESDPYEEKGYRRILNFGHTFGHALEMLENYQIEHGEAIAIGMILESYLSMRLHYLTKAEFDTIVQLFHQYQFPLRLSRRFSLEEILSSLSRDKKAVQKKMRFVILKTIGEVESFEGAYCTPIDTKLIEEAIHDIIYLS